MAKIIQFKESVRIKAWTPGLSEIMNYLESIQNRFDWIPELTITSCNDSVHLPNSQHYKDMAIDIRSHNFVDLTAKENFITMLQGGLGPKFLVLFESVGTDNEHIHVQQVRGVTFP